MRNIILFFIFLCLANSQSDEESEYVIIQGEHTLKINQSSDAVREECTALALNDAISGYILNYEVSDQNIQKIKNCLKSKLIEISIISESVIQTSFTITVQAYISEESISNCLWLLYRFYEIKCNLGKV